MKTNRAILIIMDGWGLGKVAHSDAIRAAKTPFVSSLYEKYPNSTLTTCGRAVGLPEGQMGNSEVGHLNLGAGRIVYQELERINIAIEDGALANNTELLASINYAKENGKTLHLMGLVSDGGVHSHINHLKALVRICKEKGLENVLIHAFTDGRDTDPKSGIGFLTDLQEYLKTSTGAIATVTGRYYAMDRDKRWERIKKAYDALVRGVGKKATDILKAVQESYDEGVTDEFILPIVNDNLKSTTIKDGDAVICFNFRTDRCRQITEALTQRAFPEQEMQPLDLHYTTMTIYDHTFKNVHNIFNNQDLNETMGEVLEQHQLKQIRIAETEKYPHVTFFFSGGREKPFEGERRIMIPSPKVPTYDFQPEMSAREVTETLLPEIENKTADFICLNFANADMVGHTGVWEAVVKAVETVDECVQKVVTAALSSGYTVFLTADHGNADYMINENGTPNTAHTKNLVPYFVIGAGSLELQPGKLGDVAPTILRLMNIDVPEAMTGTILFNRN
ncbi:MAG: 2,3-bisphosphoglycerate-independent phosphoglycerate mutase [Chitinophagaceae bacterium]|nr:2,3-bisphosphoglycerate-independent phosphoglycerate mutase [Chitinophagaceae bacterium]